MPVTYTNRKGETYHLLVGATKTGKPKYYVSKKAGSHTADFIPEGFELHEHPASGIVHLRRVRESKLTSAERDFAVTEIRNATGTPHFFVEIEDDALVVYWLDGSARDDAELLRTFGPGAARRLHARKVSHGSYSALMRFVLIDEHQRLFRTERMCFRSSVDGWMPISSRRPLGELIDDYAQHLGQESFFELNWPME